MPTAKSAWDIIANYEAHDIVRKRYESKHGWNPSAALAREIAAPFIQARHYYESAASADRTVKPLLLYYGVLSLSRGLILFLTRKLRDTSLAQSHGLSIVDWKSVLSLERPDLGDLMITVNGSGSFVELLNATQNRSLLRVGSSAVNQKYNAGIVPKNSILRFDELLASLPDVIGQYKRWKVPYCVPFEFKNIENSPERHITVRRWPGAYFDERIVIDIVGIGDCELISADEKQIVVRTTRGRLANCMFTDLVGDHFAGIGTRYLARGYASGISLGKIGQLFAIAYILSMLVRYHPAFWMNFVYQRVGDSAVPTIFKVIDCIETLYPRIVVDFLEEQ